MPKLTMRLLLVALSVAALAGCYKNPTIALPPPAPARLYVADFFNGLLVYTQPITSTSMPSITIPGASTGVAFDAAQNLYVADYNLNTIAVYKSPITASSTPFMTIGPITGASHLEGLTFDKSGGLYIADETGDEVLYLAPPFAPGAQLPTKTITGMPFGPTVVVFDSAGNMLTPSYGAAKVTIFRPPFVNGANTPVGSMKMPFNCSGIGIDLKDDLVVGQDNGSLEVVKPPFATGVLPSFSIAPTFINGTQATEGISSTFDSAGNLWQTFGGHGAPANTGVAEFAQPFSGSTLALLGFRGGMGFPFGIAFGP